MTSVVLQAGLPPVISQLLSMINPVVNALLFLFALAFWLSFIGLLLYAMRYFLGATPGMRGGRALEAIVDWVEGGNAKVILAVFAVVWIIYFILLYLATQAGASLGFTAWDLFRDLFIQPIITMFHYVFTG
ncbi:hypothetical protein [Vulcanisaeta souniana]|uniref:hypothetical protein n=1 Tax=Vulcanisaeta souniana TaxID=164452 RepID=UPI0006D0560F|nr:hypothetical protein [Vulcanisaeta souniana]